MPIVCQIWISFTTSYSIGVLPIAWSKLSSEGSSNWRSEKSDPHHVFEPSVPLKSIAIYHSVWLYPRASQWRSLVQLSNANKQACLAWRTDASVHLKNGTTPHLDIWHQLAGQSDQHKWKDLLCTAGNKIYSSGDKSLGDANPTTIRSLLASWQLTWTPQLPARQTRNLSSTVSPPVRWVAFLKSKFKHSSNSPNCIHLFLHKTQNMFDTMSFCQGFSFVGNTESGGPSQVVVRIANGVNQQHCGKMLMETCNGCPFFAMQVWTTDPLNDRWPQRCLETCCQSEKNAHSSVVPSSQIGLVPNDETDENFAERQKQLSFLLADQCLNAHKCLVWFGESPPVWMGFLSNWSHFAPTVK